MLFKLREVCSKQVPGKSGLDLIHRVISDARKYLSQIRLGLER